MFVDRNELECFGMVVKPGMGLKFTVESLVIK